MCQETAPLEHRFAGYIAHGEEFDLQEVIVPLSPKLAHQVPHPGVRIDQREGNRRCQIARVPGNRPSANLFGNWSHVDSPSLDLLNERLRFSAQVANQRHLLGPCKFAQDMEDPDFTPAALGDREVGGDEQNLHGAFDFSCWSLES